MPDWPSPTQRDAEVIQLREQLAVAVNNLELADDQISESWADVELAFEDQGWWRLTSLAQYEFSRQGLARAADVARVNVVVNPLINRGVALRTAYVWGQGISISARDPEINTVVQAFLDDPGNQKSLHSGQAHERQEATCASDGNLYFALFTNPRTGQVQVRTFLFEEIIDIINNPEDRNEPWYYLRQWSTVGLVPSGSGTGATSVNQVRRTYHPALGYFPTSRPKTINGIPVDWYAPVLHDKVNALDGWQYGIGDVVAALPFARMYTEFLVDWARVAKALSKFAWRLSADRSSKAQQAAAKIRSSVADVDALARAGMQGGQLSAAGPGYALEAIPKSGATINADSGRPIAAMVASALGIPVTMLLADPGQTGARAVAETLDRPTELEMEQRRDFHRSIRRRILDYVIDQAVIAPQGPLHGRIQRTGSGTGLLVEMNGDVERTIDIVFPEMTQQDPEKLVAAVVAADTTQTLPPLVVARLLLQTLGVDDVDEILDDMTDDDGNYIPPATTAGQAAVDAFNAGQDPAAALA
jgi:hypothetical protein